MCASIQGLCKVPHVSSNVEGVRDEPPQLGLGQAAKAEWVGREQKSLGTHFPRSAGFLCVRRSRMHINGVAL